MHDDNIKSLLDSFASVSQFSLALKDHHDESLLYSTDKDAAQNIEFFENIVVNGQPKYILVGSKLDPSRQKNAESQFRTLASLFTMMLNVENTKDDMAVTIRRSWRQINALVDIGVELQHQQSLSAVCDNIVNKISNILNVERISLMLPDNDGLLRIVASLGIPTEVVKNTVVKPGEPIAGKVFQECRPLLVEDLKGLSEDMKSAGRKSINGQRSSAFLSVPLIRKGGDRDLRVVGVINVTHHKHGRVFNTEDLKLLTTLASQIALIVHNHQMLSELRQRERLKQEVELASSIQSSLLPQNAIQSHGLQLFGSCRPSAIIGGDYYDYFHVSDNMINLVIADISGHGVPAAIFMTMVRSAIRTMAYTQKAPLDVSTYLNQFLLQEIPDRHVYVTGIYGQYDVLQKTLTYVVAGHPPPLVLSKDSKLETLAGKGLALGLVNEAQYQEYQAHLKSGDTVIFFTDGVYEIKNESGKMLEEAGLREMVKNIDWGSTEQGVKALTQALVEYRGDEEQKDDQTVLAFRID